MKRLVSLLTALVAVIVSPFIPQALGVTMRSGAAFVGAFAERLGDSLGIPATAIGQALALSTVHACPSSRRRAPPSCTSSSTSAGRARSQRTERHAISAMLAGRAIATTCTNKAYTGLPGILTINRVPVPAAAAVRMERAELNHQGLQRAKGAKVTSSQPGPYP